jgi:hypothetical protein
VPGEILDVVLPLPVGVVPGLTQDLSTASPDVLAVSVEVLNSHQHGGSQPDLPGSLDQDDRTPVADVELCAVVPDSDPQCETEGLAQPLNGRANIGVRQLRDDDAAGDGLIRKHWRRPSSDPVPGRIMCTAATVHSPPSTARRNVRRT